MHFNALLNEICKISAIKATSALSKFLQTPLGIDMKPIEINKIEDMNFIKSYSDATVNMSLPITGNLSGTSFFLYSKKSALSLCDVLFHRPQGSTKQFSEPEISALSEVTNIVIGNFLTPFAQSLQLDFLMHRNPDFEFAPFRKSFSKKVSMLTESSDQSLIKITFSFQNIDILGDVFIILDEKSIDAVFKNRDLSI